MSHFQNTRSEFVLAGSRLQRVGASDHSLASSADVVSLNVDVLRFGIFELDTHTLELRREGRLIHLRHQPARVLALLLERSGRLVSREEITNELWPSDVDVDVEQGLNHCIKEIRAALSDRSEAPRYIQTLPRRGYRTLVEVHRVRESAPEESGSPENVTATPQESATATEPAPDARAVRITISVSRTGEETSPLWSTALEGFAHDLETLERDFQTAFRSGLRPVLQAEANTPTERGDETEAAMPLSRRGFE
jgi:DNA-binding winged helix-turn-helix (wHTH) protein